MSCHIACNLEHPMITTLSTQGHEASSTGRQPMELSTSAANDTAAALIASLLTSVLEAPVELFRHRMQVNFLARSAETSIHKLPMQLDVLRVSKQRSPV